MVCASAYGRFAGSSPAFATSSCHCITGFPPLGSGRSDWIRTSDFDVPNVALYQAELRSDRGAESIAGRWRRLGFRHPWRHVLTSPSDCSAPLLPLGTGILAIPGARLAFQISPWPAIHGGPSSPRRAIARRRALRDRFGPYCAVYERISSRTLASSDAMFALMASIALPWLSTLKDQVVPVQKRRVLFPSTKNALTSANTGSSRP